MALSLIYARATLGIEAPLVSIEVHLGRGMPGFHLVGLPETTVKESKDRVRSAIINSGFDFPAKRITVNLAPADLPKGGGRFDLAIAIGILVASEQIPVNNLQEFEFIGELALSGELRPVRGVVPIASACCEANRALFIAKDNAQEAALVNTATIYAMASLWDVFLHLSAKKCAEAYRAEPHWVQEPSTEDLSDVQEQSLAKRALIIAAAGAHNVLMHGPPGTGKSMLASRLKGLLPPLGEAQAIENASIRSILGHACNGQSWAQRPFRSPHHTCSATALVGGGASPLPGEITLAHNGVLFLDELPEFGRHALDVLREPMETGEIHISRARHKVSFPARFQLIAALNPSPTGDADDGRSNHDQILRYLSKISGPLLDRIDIQVIVPKIDLRRSLADDPSPTSVTSAQAREMIEYALIRQTQRQNKQNAFLSSQELKQHCLLDSESRQFILSAMDKLNLSMRSYHRILKVARTIADIEGKTNIAKMHLAEAIQYRSFDRFLHHLTNN